MPVDYSNGKIYRVEPICEHLENEVYYGSTSQARLCVRWAGHKRDYKYKHKTTLACILFDKFGVENCNITLVELFPCETKDELNSREGWYHRNVPCVNRYIAGRSKADYRQDNRILINDRQREMRASLKASYYSIN